jgi:hypothetical protein
MRKAKPNINSRSWRTAGIAMLAVLVVGCAVRINTLRYGYEKNHLLRTLTAQSSELTAEKSELTAQTNELEKAKLQLQKTTQLLANAENKLGYLNRHKTAVQVTAFTGRGRFANGLKTVHSYAVPSDSLPKDKVLNVALSPAAQRNLHARMNDYIVLLDQDLGKARLARFVDTTSAKERRPVVDVFFAQRDEALNFGRQHYLAVNISAQGSPFLDE